MRHPVRSGPGGLRDRRGRDVRVPGPDGRPLSVGQRWKLRRNGVIWVCLGAGVTQRILADVFDLPHSRVAAIAKEYRLHPDRRPSWQSSP